MSTQHPNVPDVRCYTSKFSRATVLSVLLLLSQLSWPQLAANGPATPGQPPPAPTDILGRSTPRGTILGFLNASRKDDTEIAVMYLNTPLKGADALALANQLAAVLDRHLPPRINQISDKPEGSIPDPRKPNEDSIGTITTSKGNLDILVERVDRGKEGKIWLFSRKTLASIPEVFEESDTQTLKKHFPEFLVTTHLLTIPLFEWIAVFVGLPLGYFAMELLNRVLSLGVGALLRQVLRSPGKKNPSILLPSVRLLLLAVLIRWLLSRLELPLLARQFWSSVSLVIAIAACLWILMLVNGWVERYLLRRRRGRVGSASILRLVRRLVDGLILFAGLLFTLQHFGINVTAALAGLGVGGIAVALAAQKTLENVIAGISLVVDQALHVGDFLNLGDLQGTVQEIGLRSTRIRTLDRTLVSLPNAQVANIRLENLSARDKFLLHPVVSLQYETTPLQLGTVMSGIRNHLSNHTHIDSASMRVRFVRFGTYSLDIDVFAYVFACDWSEFLQIQEELLLEIMGIVRRAGTGMAIPLRTLYFGTDKQIHKTVESSQGSAPKLLNEKVTCS